MIGIKHRSANARFSRYWNALVSGASPERIEALAAEIDPELLADIALVRRGTTRHTPEPDFVDNLESTLMQSLALPRTAAQSWPDIPAPSPNGRSIQRALIGGGAPKSRRFAGAPVATAAFAIIVLIGSLFVLTSTHRQGGAPEGTETPLVVIEDATPTPTATPLPLVDGMAQFLWMTPNTGPGSIRQPGFSNLSPDGKLWVSSSATNQFSIYALDGTLLETWGESGTGDGQFQFGTSDADLGDVAFADDGTFYVTDAANGRVQAFDSNRQFLFAWGNAGDVDDPGHLVNPASIVILDDGSILVSDFFRGDIQRFAADGAFLGIFADATTVEVGLDGCAGLTLAPDGTIWLADAHDHRVHRFDAQGQWLGEVGSGPGSLPENFNSPFEVAFDSADHAHIADIGNERMSVYSLDGTYLTKWGSYGLSPGQFGAPGAITIDDADRAYVLESGWYRMQAFQLLPIPDLAKLDATSPTPRP